MHDDPDDKINAYIAAANGAIPILSAKHGHPIKSTELQDALCKALDIGELNAVELPDHQLTTDRIVELLKHFDFTPPTVLYTLHLPDEDGIIPDDALVILTEKVVKVKGEVWEIHRYDADPWPSDPHAHNYASRLKMHLGTGELFDNNRQSKGKIKAKKLAAIRAELTAAGITLPS